MGATTFVTVCKGKTPVEAFRDAVRTARYEHGHGGYTGTIAEKDEFVVIEVPESYVGRPFDYIDDLLWNSDPRINNKWGPAGCIEIKHGDYAFFGWASE